MCQNKVQIIKINSELPGVFNDQPTWFIDASVQKDNKESRVYKVFPVGKWERIKEVGYWYE